jgi:AraC-like DNA-binding protein
MGVVRSKNDRTSRMTQLSVQCLLSTATATISDVICRGDCRHASAEECASTTHLVFPYRGVYVRHARSEATVAEANQLLFFNAGEGYRISHPLSGGDACLSIAIGGDGLQELAPREHLENPSHITFKPARLRIDSRAQALAAQLRYGLTRKITEPLEAETATVALVRRALGLKTSHVSRGTAVRRKLVDRVKLVLSSDLSRRWSLADIAAEVGGSPVYLTQVFQQVEGMPLSRYQLRLRLARSLELLGQYHDLSRLGADLGFSSHSHFSAAFRQAFGRTPGEFQRSVGHGLPRSRK